MEKPICSHNDQPTGKWCVKCGVFRPTVLPLPAALVVNLDSFDLATAQGFGTGVPLARFDIIKGGKRITVHVDLFQHEMKADPTIRMTAVKPTRDTTQTIQVRPWTPLEE